MNIKPKKPVRAFCCGLLLVILQSALVVAGQGEGLQLIRSKSVEGFYFGLACHGISGDFTNDTPIDAELCAGLWTTNTNSVLVYIPSEPEYAYLVELFDMNGRAVPKTDYGRRFGKDFFNLDAKLLRDGPKFEKKSPPHEPDYASSPLFFQTRPSVGAGYKYNAKDLFVVKNPGKYTLQIRFQIVVRTGTGKDMTAHVVRFPAVEYPLFVLKQ